jgi:hypothetical protein
VNGEHTALHNYELNCVFIFSDQWLAASASSEKLQLPSRI